MYLKIYAVLIPEVINSDTYNKMLNLVKINTKTYNLKKFVAELTLCSELLKLYSINKAFNIPPDKIEFYKNTFGKPYIKGYKGVYFNISHSDKAVICAVSDAEIGIDIQKRKKLNFNRIINKYFTDEEKNYIDKTKDKTLAFFEVWTKKESYIKLKGKGISKGIRDTDYSSCEFRSFTLFDEYQVCLCYKNKIT